MEGQKEGREGGRLGRWMEVNGQKERNKEFPFWYIFFALLLIIFLSLLSGCISGNLGIRVSQDLGGFIKTKPHKHRPFRRG